MRLSRRGLTPAAVAHLTHDALGTLDLTVLAPVKGLLKRFFSDQPWTAADDRSLADLVGAGEGWWQHDLDKDYRIEFGWRDGVFRLEVAPRRTLGETFAGPVVPEATPNPRTIRFVTPPIHDGPSRWYESAADVDDPRIARLFAEFDDVANVLVGPDFVAVGLHRPDRWEELLDPVLRAVTGEFASPTADVENAVATGAEPRGAALESHSESAPGSRGRPRTRLEGARFTASRRTRRPRPDPCGCVVSEPRRSSGHGAPSRRRRARGPRHQRGDGCSPTRAEAFAARPSTRSSTPSDRRCAPSSNVRCMTPMHGRAGRPSAASPTSASSRAAPPSSHSSTTPTSGSGSRQPALAGGDASIDRTSK